MAAIMQTVPLFSTVFALLLLHDTITSLTGTARTGAPPLDQERYGPH